MRVVAPGKMPALGKGGSLASRQAILHSLVHIESWAVDLSWDAVARFGSDPQYALPEAFLDDFVQVRHRITMSSCMARVTMLYLLQLCFAATFPTFTATMLKRDKRVLTCASQSRT